MIKMKRSFGRAQCVRDYRDNAPISTVKNESAPIRAVTQLFADDTVVNALELSQALRVSRWTLDRWRKGGYVFEFGNRSTPGHLKAWLRENPRKRAVKSAMPDDLAKKLAQLR
jgi:hypothetical protein